MGSELRPAPPLSLPRLILVLVVASVLGCGACKGPGGPDAEPAKRSAATVEEPLGEVSLAVVELLVPEGEPRGAALRRELSEGRFVRLFVERTDPRFSETPRWQVEWRSVPGTASPEPSDAEPAVRLTVGTPPWSDAAAERIAAWARGLPLELVPSEPGSQAGSRIRFDGTVYDLDQVTLSLRRPREEGSDEDLPQEWLVLAGSPERAAETADLGLVRSAGVQVFGRRSEEPQEFELQESRWVSRSGTFRRAGPGAEAAWEVDPETDRDGFAERDRWWASLAPVVPGGGAAGDGAAGDGTAGGAEASLLTVLAPPDLEPEARQAVDRLTGELRRALVAMAPRVPLSARELAERPLTVVIEKDFVDQALHTGQVGAAVLTPPARRDPGGGRGDLHLVLHPRDGFAHRHGLALLLLRRAGVEDAAPPWLAQGAALWLSEDWYGRSWQGWLPTLAAAGALPTAEQLLAPEEQRAASGPLWVPAAAALVDRETGPGPTARARLAALAAAPPGELDRRLRELRRLAPAGPPPVTSRPLPPGFQRGVSFAMLNRLEGGYHAPSVIGELGRLGEMGADAVSIMPFAYQPGPTSWELAFMNRGPTSENDTGLIHAARRSHEAGFSVLWKPHIWISHDSWPGAVEMADEAAWDRWWERYRLYVLHHAFLARWCETEIFSLGVELSLTVQRPEWYELIEAVRWLDPGALTYAANWGQEAETVPFWDRLDAVGIDAYYPLLEGGRDEVADATPEELLAGARRVVGTMVAIAERADRPLLLTEVGYPRREVAWHEPHAEGGELSDTHQRMAYRALVTALLEAPPEQLRGVYVWKAFSSETRDRGRSDFQFLDRPASAEVARLFAEVGGPGPETGPELGEEPAARATGQ